MNFMLMHSKKTKSTHLSRLRQRGFTLLLAALVASVVVGLGGAIFQIARKQVLLSGVGRDSQFAFYAADTAAECALYWDFRSGYFATTTPAGITPSCDGQSMLPFTTVGNPANFPNAPDTSYTKTSAPMNLFQDTTPLGGYCAEVYVEKKLDASTGAVRTTIHANGYNVDCNAKNTSARALQRSIELHY